MDTHRKNVNLGKAKGANKFNDEMQRNLNDLGENKLYLKDAKGGKFRLPLPNKMSGESDSMHMDEKLEKLISRRNTKTCIHVYVNTSENRN